MRDEQSSAGFYNQDAAQYDRRFSSEVGEWNHRGQERAIARLLERHGLGTQALEVGPGTGRITELILSYPVKLTTLDVSSSMLSELEARIAGLRGIAGSITEYRVGSIYQLPFEDGSFDSAIAINVLSHVEHIGRALAEVVRVVRPGGVILFNYPNSRSAYWPGAAIVNRRGRAVSEDVVSYWKSPAIVAAAMEGLGVSLDATESAWHVPSVLSAVSWPLVRVLDRLGRTRLGRAASPVRFELWTKDAQL